MTWRSSAAEMKPVGWRRQRRVSIPSNTTNKAHEELDWNEVILTVSILVENLEGFLDFLFRVCILHLSRHHSQELGCKQQSTAFDSNEMSASAFTTFSLNSKMKSQKQNVTHGNQLFHFHQHRLHWSCLEVQPLWESDLASAWLCRVPLWWWFRLHLRTQENC